MLSGGLPATAYSEKLEHCQFSKLHKGKKIELNGFLKHSRTKRDMIVPS